MAACLLCPVPLHCAGPQALCISPALPCSVLVVQSTSLGQQCCRVHGVRGPTSLAVLGGSEPTTQLTACSTVTTALAGKAAIPYLPASVSHRRTARGCRGRAGAGEAPGANPLGQGGGEQLPGLLSLSAGAALGCSHRLAARRAVYLHGRRPAEEGGSQCQEGEGFWGAGSASRTARRAKLSSTSAPQLQG